MTGETHRLCGKTAASAVFIGLNAEPFIELYKTGFDLESLKAIKVLHITDTWTTIVTSLAILLTLRIFARMTSVLNDLDQQPGAIPYKGNKLAKICNSILQILGQHHRSHATHTIFIQIAVSALLIFVGLKFFERTSIVVLVIFGFICGTASHIIADMFNGVGVYILPICKKKAALVPKKINSAALKVIGTFLVVLSIVGYLTSYIDVELYALVIISLVGLFLIYIGIKFKNMRFNTGNQWENIFFKLTNILDNVLTTLAWLICFI